jgi:hypothetical protein
VALRRPVAGKVEQVLDDAPRAVGFLDEEVGIVA